MHTMGIDIGTTTISVVLLDVDRQELMEMHGKPCGIGLTGQMHGMRRPVTDLRRIIICSRRNGYRRQQ